MHYESVPFNSILLHYVAFLHKLHSWCTAFKICHIPYTEHWWLVTLCCITTHSQNATLSNIDPQCRLSTHSAALCLAAFGQCYILVHSASFTFRIWWVLSPSFGIQICMHSDLSQWLWIFKKALKCLVMHLNASYCLIYRVIFVQWPSAKTHTQGMQQGMTQNRL